MHIVRYQDDGPRFHHMLHVFHAFLLKENIPDGKSFVYYQDIGINADGSGKGQADKHAA